MKHCIRCRFPIASTKGWGLCRKCYWKWLYRGVGKAMRTSGIVTAGGRQHARQWASRERLALWRANVRAHKLAILEGE